MAGPEVALGSRRSASPSEAATSSAPGIICLSWLNGWPMPPPTDASPADLAIDFARLGAGAVREPSPERTFTSYSLPVSRRIAPTFRNEDHVIFAGPCRVA
jgi:hypothetical protein